MNKGHVEHFREEAREKAKKVRSRRAKRYALIGLATVGGGALIGTHTYTFSAKLVTYSIYFLMQ